MVKRQKWTQQEDSYLQTLVGTDAVSPPWEQITYDMERRGYSKSLKQCRDR